MNHDVRLRTQTECSIVLPRYLTQNLSNWSSTISGKFQTPPTQAASRRYLPLIQHVALLENNTSLSSCISFYISCTISHNYWSQELCCFRSRHLEQSTNRPASFVTVDGNFCTTPEGTPVPRPVARLSF